MKICRLLLLFICLLMSVRLYAQQSSPVTLSFKNAPLETIILQIKKQTGVNFFYNKDILKLAGRITIQADKAELESVLNKCLKNTPVSYAFIGNIVVLSNKNGAKNADGSPVLGSNMFTNITANGVIANVRGERLNGPSVIIKRNHLVTTANNNGEFSIDN